MYGTTNIKQTTVFGRNYKVLPSTQIAYGNLASHTLYSSESLYLVYLISKWK
jgi:hypothetical protein